MLDANRLSVQVPLLYAIASCIALAAPVLLASLLTATLQNWRSCWQPAHEHCAANVRCYPAWQLLLHVQHSDAAAIAVSNLHIAP